MNRSEREEARRFVQLQEDLKDPVKKMIYENIQRKAEQEKKRQEILNNWSSNGYRPPMPEVIPKPSEEEQERERILKQYS